MENSVNNWNYFLLSYFISYFIYYFISSEDSEEERVMHSSSYIIKFTSYSEVNDVIKKLFKSLRSKHQDGFETSMKGSDFIFDSVQLIYY